MVDYAEGGVLYNLGSEVHSLKVGNASDTLLLEGAAGKPVFVTQDTHGLGWAQGAKEHFACDGCVRYVP